MAYTLGSLKKSLVEFNAERDKKPGKKCWCCSLPPDVRCQIERGFFDHKIPIQAIIEWLQEEHGYTEANRGRVQSHLSRHDRIKVEG